MTAMVCAVVFLPMHELIERFRAILPRSLVYMQLTEF